MKLDAIVKLAQKDPARSPSWRWDLVGSIMSGPAVSEPKVRDRWIRKGIELWKLRHRPAEVAGTSLEPVWMAHRIYLWDNPSRWLLEARILAGQSDDEIAGKLGVDRRTVAAYEALFFNVRDRLDNPDYIMGAAIGTISATISHGNMEPLWKLYAYFGGPVMLEHLAYNFPGGRANSAMDLQSLARDLIGASLEVRALVASRVMKVTNRQAIPIINTYLKLTAPEDAGSTNRTLDTIGRILDSIEVKVREQPDPSAGEQSINRLKGNASGPELPEAGRPPHQSQ